MSKNDDWNGAKCGLQIAAAGVRSTTAQTGIAECQCQCSSGGEEESRRAFSPTRNNNGGATSRPMAALCDFGTDWLGAGFGGVLCLENQACKATPGHSRGEPSALKPPPGPTTRGASGRERAKSMPLPHFCVLALSGSAFGWEIACYQ
jgi:hypothetical protein